MSVEQTKEEEFSFRLFGSAPPKTVRISTPEPSDEAPVRRRPNSYYFSSVSADLKTQYASTAVSGIDIVRQSSIPLPGMHMPWRVIDYTQLSERQKLDNKRNHARPGKKSREARRKLKAKKVQHIKQNRVYGLDRTYGSKLRRTSPNIPRTTVQKHKKNKDKDKNKRPKSTGYPQKVPKVVQT